MSSDSSEQRNAISLKRGKEKWPVKKTENSRLAEVDFDHLNFGKVFSDHMFVAKYANGAWREVGIEPYANLSLSPATSALHYGQSIFEGMKAYRDINGRISLYRPEMNFERINKSAKRMAMPAIPYELFMDGIWELVQLDKDWIPNKEGSSLYIRPFLFATDPFIGVSPGTEYTFLIITSPSGAYYSKPLDLLVADYYVRAAEGGVGEAKAAINYAASLYPAEEALSRGFDQILWTDAKEHKYFQECGTMNMWVVIDGVAITPSLEKHTVLPGVTRESIIEILRDRNIPVEERDISIDEVIQAEKDGKLDELFGSGTAANIIYVNSLQYKGLKIEPKPSNQWKIAPSLLKELNDIHYGRIEDTRNWMWRGY
ncbi:MAG TPA: branched-chain amino acid aminotransferase [Chitinophagaceae bacterium]|nr:branched-chain amino acid aminotransferase [Chitinophagaceae bacterium]